MPLLPVTDPADPELADYLHLTDAELRRRVEPAEGRFLAEGDKVVARAVAAGYPVRSLLLEERRLPEVRALLPDVVDAAPVYVGTRALIAQLTGFDVHRGVLASMERRPLPPLADLLAAARRVVVLEDLVDPSNVGSVFRAAAALGVDAVVLSPRCADPLYRKAVKVSMGAVLALPYARLERWPDGYEQLRTAGLRLLALTPAPDAVPLPALRAEDVERCALLLGAEGAGLTRQALAAADVRVRIPMASATAGAVDSLNVAAAAAVACYAVAQLAARG
ncbi:MAG: RNA methyltransferase [Actinomycetota bacterium]|nr:RNA methyltransferase [Actinomycetota bacterium]